MRHIKPDYTKRWAVLFVTACLAGSPAVCGAILRVKAGVTNAAPDGLSWTNAFPGVIEALTVAQSGDQVWVAAGTYPGGFTLASGIALYGGFAGVEESLTQRDFTANLSRLDGARRITVVHVAAGAGPTTRVDGFIIQHGLANGAGVLGSGGGLRVTNAEPVIANNQFLSNNCALVGGAVYLGDSASSLISNYFGFNGTESTVRDGGALAAVRSSPQIEANSFVGNRGRDGGAIFLSSSTGFLLGNSLLSNTATRDGGGVYCGSASPQITHNRFLGNTAPARGGGVALIGGSATLLFNNVFARNVAGSSVSEPSGGGGVFSDTTSQPNILNNTLVLNQAAVGGLLISNRNATVANNIIAFGSSGVGGVDFSRFQANNVYGNSVNYVGIEDPTGTGGNLSADPKFGGDLSLGVVNILPDSPCRDAGNTAIIPPGATDVDGQPRVQGTTVDMGADETDGVSTYFLPTVVYVALRGDDANDGGSWSRPKRTVQAAIELAGRRGGEVWVESGAYAERLTLRPFTSLYGGFAGAETNRVQRDWRLRETILDAQGNGRVLVAQGLQFDEGVDGFTLRNGAAVAGGGVYAEGKVRLANNRFEANEATPAASATQAQGGGALYLAGGDMVILNNTFVRNRASSASRTLSADGGAIKLVDGRPTIANNLFRMNLATNSVASSVARGGALLVLSNAAPRVINNTLLQNSVAAVSGTARGGAISFDGTLTAGAPTPLLVNNLVAYNSSGIAASGDEPQLYNNLVWGSVGSNYEGLDDPTGSNGNLSRSPGLTGPYGDPHLTASSPARDAGDDSVVQDGWLDLDGKPRIVGDAPDIGADEFDGTTYQVPARVFRVSPEGSDNNSGGSWNAAKRTVGAALAAAAVEGGEVWVRAGTYVERVRVELFTYLYGGFQGTESSREARNWFAQPSILDGGANQANPVAGSPVVTVLGTDGYASVDGLTIQNGAGRLGGGLFVSGSPLIAHNTIRSNVVTSTDAGLSAVGAGLVGVNGSPTIINNLFVANRAVHNARPTNCLGGGIYLNTPAGQVPSVLHNTFLDNSAGGEGGAVFLRLPTSARIMNNIVAFGNSGLVADGATNASIVQFNCVFDNTVNYKGLIPGPGSLEQDPGLVDWRAGNYRLRADSPCINSGDASVAAGNLDFYAEPRLSGTAPDIGADEYSGPPAADFRVAITQPVSGSVYVAPATVFLSASISGGSTSPDYIEYLANGALAAVGTESPFSAFASGLIAGNYMLVARAVTASGTTATSAPVAISVVLPPDNVPPTVRFTAPTNGQAYVSPANVRTTFTWTKTGGRITRWDLLTNGVLAATNPNVPSGTTSATLTIPNLLIGEYQLTAIVHDNVGTSANNSVDFVVSRGNPDPSVPQPPQWQTNGTLVIEFSAPTADANYVLDRTLDLIRWTPVSTNQGGAPIRVTVPVNRQIPLEAFRTRAYYP